MTTMISRRRLVGGVVAFAGASMVAGAPRAELLPTPLQGEGPFYPYTLPLDSDADLASVAGQPRGALGDIAHIAGRVMSEAAEPIPGATVEIWQCDANSQYHQVGARGPVDPGFQGFGATVTDVQGAYHFRTIKPVPYPGRTPHIHFAVLGPGIERMTTQMYLEGHPLNDVDRALGSVPEDQRQRLMVHLEPSPELEVGALSGDFDIVLGYAN